MTIPQIAYLKIGEMAYEDFLGTNHQLEYLKLYVSLFVEIPKKILS